MARATFQFTKRKTSPSLPGIGCQGVRKKEHMKDIESNIEWENPLIDRRELFSSTLRSAALGLGATAFSASALSAEAQQTKTPPKAKPKPPRKTPPPSDKLVLALIGCGGMGVYNLQKLMEKPEVQIAAVCDVDTTHMSKASNLVEEKYGKKPRSYKDYRRVIDRDDIDGVIIATPDHWHALPLIYACGAEKDAYCEKPISHNIVEAKAMEAAVRKSGRIVQIGTWQRSIQEFMSAIDYIRSGKLGKVVQVRAWKTDEQQVGKLIASKSPATLDYDLWTGPAALAPYREKAVHFNWRWFLNYGSGMTGDWGVHMIDIALLAMSAGNDLVMPYEVYADGGKWAYPADDRTAPDTVIAMMRFKDPDFVLHWETQRSHPDRPDQGVQFISSDGKSLMVWRRGWKVTDKTGVEVPKDELDKDLLPLQEDHWQNWLDCVKSRKTPRAPLSSLARTTIACHLINAAQISEQVVRWDNVTKDIVGKAGKDTTSYVREYRRPYQLPKA